ncbi:MAG: signal peptidase I [Oscillospiraceae bacterium]
MAEKNNPEQPKLTRAEEFKQDLYFWLQALVMALVALILLFTFVGRIIAVDGPSMLPTLHDGDMLLLRSIGYTPEQGDIVVLTKDFSHYTDQPIVKRVIAVGGQTVRIDYEESKVYVDGVALDEPYINESIMIRPGPGSALSIEELTVPEGSVFVLGDNRNDSSDSRHVELGAIDERYILGKAVMILLPFRDLGLLN